MGGKTEKVLIEIKSFYKFADVAGNTLEEIIVSSFLNELQVLSEIEEKGAKSAGVSLRYILVIIFIVNVILNLVFSSSMKYMWDLTHLL